MQASEQAVINFLYGYFSGFWATPPVLGTDVARELLDAILTEGELVKVEDIVDEYTASLIDQLTEQNKLLQKTAELYAQKIAAVDFITLDRDTWKGRALAAERESERTLNALAREQ